MLKWLITADGWQCGTFFIYNADGSYLIAKDRIVINCTTTLDEGKQYVEHLVSAIIKSHLAETNHLMSYFEEPSNEI